VLLSDHLPVSNDNRIQVKLVEPILRNASNVKLNRQNNLEFYLNMPASKTQEVAIKYTIEHPADDEIEFINGDDSVRTMRPSPNITPWATIRERGADHETETYVVN
jgi:hypothetical protein